MPIQVLPPQLANQIAAGEVVERPASVVKELIENSLDAGATRIDIDIENGGATLIRIRDNGYGIGKEELTLALARHATSKISSLDDLEAILSLGFRGEALASISSVSRLTLTSRTAAQSEAWQAYAEGREMAVTVKPAAHPVGSTLEVRDLFYNTPARRKFMRTEKTEFAHIDEVVRRIALARFDVAFTLHHNGKAVRQYRAAQDETQHQRRLGSLCGAAFLQHALAISWQHSDLSIRGWVADPTVGEALPEMQYCYVNNRMMRDRLINHAIRQAFQERLSADYQPAYVLYLELAPHQVDVNVHPAKHEVRFHQARLVHDFIYQAVSTVLQHASAPRLAESGSKEGATFGQAENRAAAGGNHFSPPEQQAVTSERQKTPIPVMGEVAPNYSTSSERAHRPPSGVHCPPGSGYQKSQGDAYRQLLQPAVPELPELVIAPPASVSSPPPTSTTTLPVVEPQATVDHKYSFGRVLMIYPPSFALIAYQQGIALLALTVAERWLKQAQLSPGSEGLRPQPLLIPLIVKLAKEEVSAFQQHEALLTQLGIEITVEKNQLRGTLRAVPLPLRQQNLQKLIPELLSYLAQQGTQQKMLLPELLASWLARQLNSEHVEWNQAQAIQLLAEVERLCPQLVRSPPAGLLQPVDIQSALAVLTEGDRSVVIN